MNVLILQIFLAAAALIFGGYYEYTGCVCGIFLCLYLVGTVRKKGTLLIYSNWTSITVTVLALFYLLAAFYGADPGMSVLGGIKFLSLPLFLLVIMQLDNREKEAVFGAVPLCGCLIVWVSILSWITGLFKDSLFLSGRLGGTFQYSNTMALYLLIGIYILQYCKTQEKWYPAALSTLYFGILLTGSRTVFVMSVLVLLFSAVKNKSVRLLHIIIIAGSATLGIGYVLLTSDFQNIGRFLTISSSSSTLIGRFLYWQDSIPMIRDHPLGLGYMGYRYLQGQYQTGVYGVAYVHNDFLQMALDAGVIPAVMFAAAVVKSFITKNTGALEKGVLLLTAAHSFVDFDLQYLAVFYILLLTMDFKSGREYTLNYKKVQVPLCMASGALCAVWMYFLIPMASSYTGGYAQAVRWYPPYTEAKVRNLENCDSLKEAGHQAHILSKAGKYIQ